MRTALVIAAICWTSVAHADTTMFARIRDDSGDVAGLPGWKLQRKAGTNHCGGIAIVTIAGKKKLSADEQPLANLFALAFPTKLNFSPDPKDRKVKEASLKKFNDFITSMKKVGGDATKFYQATIDKDKSVEGRARATARIAQIQMRLVSLLARAEIPKDVRTGEFAADKIEAFCDQMSDVAEPILAGAEEAMAVCAKATENAPAGWWTAVCTK